MQRYSILLEQRIVVPFGLCERGVQCSNWEGGSQEILGHRHCYLSFLIWMTVVTHMHSISENSLRCTFMICTLFCIHVILWDCFFFFKSGFQACQTCSHNGFKLRQNQDFNWSFFPLIYLFIQNTSHLFLSSRSLNCPVLFILKHYNSFHTREYFSKLCVLWSMLS